MSEKLKEELEECKKNLKELERLKLVEQSVIMGLREEGFSEKALELFRYRKNYLTIHPSDYKANVVGSFTGSCGDKVEIYLKIKGDMIKEARFLTDGCPGAVTSASALIELAVGKNTEEARKLNVISITEYLKEGSRGLPKHMYDCCGIAVGALINALKNYK